MSVGTVIESGVLPDGTPYRIWKRDDPYGRGKHTIAYIGDGKGKRRNVKWIREVQSGKRQIKEKT